GCGKTKRPAPLRQVGPWHETLIEHPLDGKGHLPRTHPVTPGFTAARRLVSEASQHVACKLCLDRGPGFWDEQQVRAPDRLDLLIVAAEGRRVDAPAQSAATPDLVLLRSDEHLDAAIRHRAEEQVACRGPELRVSNAGESLRLTAQLVDLFEKRMQAHSGIGVSRR